MFKPRQTGGAGTRPHIPRSRAPAVDIVASWGKESGKNFTRPPPPGRRAAWARQWPNAQAGRLSRGAAEICSRAGPTQGAGEPRLAKKTCPPQKSLISGGPQKYRAAPNNLAPQRPRRCHPLGNNSSAPKLLGAPRSAGEFIVNSPDGAIAYPGLYPDWLEHIAGSFRHKMIISL